jgi:hypothetical protein
MQANGTNLEQLDVFALMAKAMSMQPLGHEAMELRQPNKQVPERPAAEGAPRRRGWLERLDHWFWEREQREVEAHLAKSTDIYDLEARIRDLERGALYRYY